MFLYRLRIKCSNDHNRMLPETCLDDRQGDVPRNLGSSQDELKDVSLVYGIYITRELCS